MWGRLRFARIRRRRREGYLPDTFPVPSRDALREILEYHRTVNVPEHLKEWSALMGGRRQDTLSVRRFSRIFRLQHYMRAICYRHGEALRRHTDDVQAALAEYFGCDERTIRADVQEITSRLGQGWERTLTAPTGA